jgi:hypothetical protein
MTVQFPANPPYNDYEFVATNGARYTWDGKKWFSNKEIQPGQGGGTGDELWTKDPVSSDLYPIASGDGVSVRGADSIENINLSSDGTIKSKNISFDDFTDLPV